MVRSPYSKPPPESTPATPARAAAVRAPWRESGGRSVQLEISVNEVIGAREPCNLGGEFAIHVCTVEDIFAEKLRAFLQQRPRNRERAQDVLDIASLLEAGVPIRPEVVAEFLLEKARARGIEVSQEAFRDPELAERARSNYEALEGSCRNRFPPFEVALGRVLGFVASLRLPGEEG